jgi:hypothetical protein
LALGFNPSSLLVQSKWSSYPVRTERASSNEEVAMASGSRRPHRVLVNNGGNGTGYTHLSLPDYSVPVLGKTHGNTALLTTPPNPYPPPNQFRIASLKQRSRSVSRPSINSPIRPYRGQINHPFPSFLPNLLNHPPGSPESPSSPDSELARQCLRSSLFAPFRKLALSPARSSLRID